MWQHPKIHVDTLVSRAMIALEETGMKKFAIAGGVASNTANQSSFQGRMRKEDVEFYHPSPILYYEQRSNDRLSSLL